MEKDTAQCTIFSTLKFSFTVKKKSGLRMFVDFILAFVVDQFADL